MRRTDILALGIAGDVHLYAVQAALAKKGENLKIWYTTDFPSQATETLEYKAYYKRSILRGLGFSFTNLNPTVVWNRRVSYDRRHEALADKDCEFAEIECHKFREGFLAGLAPDAFWINSRVATVHSENKLFQHEAAQSLGVRAPHSLYSNDPQAIRSFIRAHGGTIIYKPFLGSGWDEEGTKWGCYSALCTEEELPEDRILQAVPGIYQEVVPKEYELRITMMGNHAFCARIDSQHTEKGRIDWRLAYDEIKMEPMDTPVDVGNFCSALLKKLGLAFGCFDFIVTPAGEVVFLELNQQGQFLFVEHYTEMPLLDAFTDFLVDPSQDFRWTAGRTSVSYEEVRGEAEARALESLRSHLPMKKPKDRKAQENEEIAASG